MTRAQKKTTLAQPQPQPPLFLPDCAASAASIVSYVWEIFGNLEWKIKLKRDVLVENRVVAQWFSVVSWQLLQTIR